MPFIKSTLTISLTEKERNFIKSELGQIITEIPGKTEQSLMISIDDQQTLYLGGEIKEKAAFIEVMIFGVADRDAKQAIISKISTFYEDNFSIPKNCIYITFTEVKDWGWNGNLL